MNLPSNRPHPIQAQVQKSPRVVGLKILAFAVAVLAGNAAVLTWVHLFYPLWLVAGFALFAAGLWLTVLGRPTNAETGKTPFWWDAGAAILVLAAIGWAIELSGRLTGS